MKEFSEKRKIEICAEHAYNIKTLAAYSFRKDRLPSWENLLEEDRNATIKLVSLMLDGTLNALDPIAKVTGEDADYKNALNDIFVGVVNSILYVMEDEET